MAIAPKKTTPAAKPAAAAAAKPAAPKTATSGAALIAGSAGTLKESKLVISTTVLENGTIKGEPVSKEDIEVRLFATTPAMAVCGFKVKKNLGNFESAEFFVSQSVPCYVEELDNVQSQVNENVARVMDELVGSFDPSAFGLSAEGESGLGDVTGGEGEAEADESGEGAAEEEGEVTQEYIESADRADLEALIEGAPEGTFSFTADEYPEDDDLRSMMIAELFPDGEEGAEGDADATEEAGDEYTEEQLLGADMDDLKNIFEAWQLGAFPAYNAKNEKIVKKKAVKTILDFQANPT